MSALKKKFCWAKKSDVKKLNRQTLSVLLILSLNRNSLTMASNMKRLTSSGIVANYHYQVYHEGGVGTILGCDDSLKLLSLSVEVSYATDEFD